MAFLVTDIPHVRFLFLGAGGAVPSSWSWLISSLLALCNEIVAGSGDPNKHTPLAVGRTPTGARSLLQIYARETLLDRGAQPQWHWQKSHGKVTVI